MSEFTRARAWREKMGLSQQALGDLTGYSREAVFWFEAGRAPPGRNGFKAAKIRPRVWLRYRRACQAVDHELRTKRKFGW